MDEVDKIIIHSLRQIGCDVDENIKNLASFDTELVVKAVVRCLDVIKPGLELNPVLPANMAARFRMGTTLAQHCSDLGYKGDIGYQTFLYNSEADLRRLFMFLIEKFPKESEKTISEPISKRAQLEKVIASALASEMSRPWLPHYCHTGRSEYDVRITVPFHAVYLDNDVKDDEESSDDVNNFKLSLLDRMPHPEQLIPSIITLNSRLCHSSTTTEAEMMEWLRSAESDKTDEETSESDSHFMGRLMSGIKLKDAENKEQEIAEACSSGVQEEPKKVADEKTAEEQEVEILKSDCETLRSKILEVQEDVKKLSSKVQYLSKIEQKESKEFAKIEDENKIELKAIELLENGEENIKKLEEAIEAIVHKLMSLANQWEKHRVPVITKYRDEKEKYSSKASASQKKLDELRALEEKEIELQEESRNKDQQYSQLVVEVQKLPKDVNRSAYTQRILEIINNVRKQKDEIDKVLADTREIQKEINMLTGRLDRSFAVVDELIFRDARTNETSRKAYKLLATLHSDCNEIVRLVEETGATVREIRDLEEQVDSESAKNVGANLERITADLKQMRQETAILTAQLERKNSG